MKTKSFLPVLLIHIICCINLHAQTTLLYPIIKNNLWGYINTQGQVVIKPQFLSAKYFYEDLAAVRVNGTYGYINTNGQIVIKPQFDIAYSFQAGIAKVYINGTPLFIDKQGNVLFKHHYKEIAPFNHKQYAVVETFTKKKGIINRSGQLVVDTIFKEIGVFENGVASVMGLNHNPYPNDTISKPVHQIGVIDTLGHWVVKYGIYKSIEGFHNGMAEVDFMENDSVDSDGDNGMIDNKGNYKFTIHFKKWSLDYSAKEFHENLAVVKIYSVNYDSIHTWSSDKHYDYAGVINKNGKIIFSNPNWYKLTPFNHHRAFAQNKEEKWQLINTNGQAVTNTLYDKILFNAYDGDPEDLFTNGIAFVKTTDGWGVIDTNGKYITAPRILENVSDYRLIRAGHLVIFQNDVRTEDDANPYRYGFWNTKNNTIVKPIYNQIDFDWQNDELIIANLKNASVYVNQQGQKIWQQGKTSKKHQVLNIDCMNRGYYYASSEYKKELAGFGGWGGSSNKSKQAPSNLKLHSNALQVIIDPSQKTKWAKKYKGVKLFVINNQTDTTFFSAQDSRIYLKLQALAAEGQWKDIEYLPSSWCGNSYHTMFLAASECWEFAAPIYQGEFKTKIRAKLEFKKTHDQKEEDILYSNEIDGSVNPAQFWNKRTYYPNGIMDPYND